MNDNKHENAGFYVDANGVLHSTAKAPEGCHFEFVEKSTYREVWLVANKDGEVLEEAVLWPSLDAMAEAGIDTSLYRIPVFDATPPADLPEQIIVMDAEFAKRHPTKGFYLRIQKDHAVETVDLDGEMTLPGAVQRAYALGYQPKHWIDASGGALSLLPDGIVLQNDSARRPKP